MQSNVASSANNKNKYNPQELLNRIIIHISSANNKNKYNPQERGNHYAELRISANNKMGGISLVYA